MESWEHPGFLLEQVEVSARLGWMGSPSLEEGVSLEPWRGVSEGVPCEEALLVLQGVMSSPGYDH